MTADEIAPVPGCILCGDPVANHVTYKGRAFDLCYGHMVMGADDEVRSELFQYIIDGVKLPPSTIKPPIITEQNIQDVKAMMARHAKRCPYCEGNNLTSGMTDHKCLDCGRKFEDSESLPARP